MSRADEQDTTRQKRELKVGLADVGLNSNAINGQKQRW